LSDGWVSFELATKSISIIMADEEPPPTKKAKTEPEEASEEEASEEGDTCGISYNIDGVFDGTTEVLKGSRLHNLEGNYEVIFYHSEHLSGDDEEENISRTARGTVTLSIHELDGKKALLGKYKIDSEPGPYYLKGDFAEDIFGGDSAFDFFMPTKIPENKTIWDGMKESREIDEDDEEAQAVFFSDVWKCRRQGTLRKFVKPFVAKLEADELPGLDHKPENLQEEIAPTPPSTFTFLEGDLYLAFEEAGAMDDEIESNKCVFFRKISDS
jgi:hypothetical protein